MTSPTLCPASATSKQLADESTDDTLQVDTAIEVAGQNVPVTVAAVAYAIAREALTNVRRHATASTRASICA